MLTKTILTLQVGFILARHAMDAGHRHRADAVVGGIRGHVQGRGQIQDVSCNAGRIFYLQMVGLVMSQVLNFVEKFFGAGVGSMIKTCEELLIFTRWRLFAQKC